MSISIETQEQFDNISHKKYVVDFSASWCGPCKKFAPIYDKLAAQYPEIGFYKLDIDDLEDLAFLYEATAVPTFVFFEGKDVKDKITGANEARVKEALEKLKLLSNNKRSVT